MCKCLSRSITSKDSQKSYFRELNSCTEAEWSPEWQERLEIKRNRENSMDKFPFWAQCLTLRTLWMHGREAT
jgi:hypothetical protein